MIQSQRGLIGWELEEMVTRELESGERALWVEQPIPSFFTAASATAFLFAIPWTAFAIFWMFAAAGFKQPDLSEGGFALFPLFGLPFVLIGLGMLSAPLWTYWKARKTLYVITDRRAIILDGGWSTTVRSYPPDSLQNIHRKEKRNGTGDVIIGQRIWTGQHGRQHLTGLGFIHIRDPRSVEQMLRKLAERASASRA